MGSETSYCPVKPATADLTAGLTVFPVPHFYGNQAWTGLSFMPTATEPFFEPAPGRHWVMGMSAEH